MRGGGGGGSFHLLVKYALEEKKERRRKNSFTVIKCSGKKVFSSFLFFSFAAPIKRAALYGKARGKRKEKGNVDLGEKEKGNGGTHSLFPPPRFSPREKIYKGKA